MTTRPLPLTRVRRLQLRALLAWTAALLAPVLTVTAGWLLVALYGLTAGVLVLCAVCGGAVHAAIAPDARARTRRWVIERDRDLTDVIPLHPLGPVDVLERLDADMERHLRGGRRG